MKKLLALILAVILVLSCAACAASTTKTGDAQPTDTSTTTESSTETTAEEEAPADAAETKDVTIGLSIYSADISYFVAMQHGVEDYCAQQGYEVIVHDEKMDETEMVSGCINLLNQGVDALLVSRSSPRLSALSLRWLQKRTSPSSSLTSAMATALIRTTPLSSPTTSAAAVWLVNTWSTF